MRKISLPSKVFVTGTDTGIGKTFVSSVLSEKMKASYWKIIQTGNDSDKEFVKSTTTLSEDKIIDEAYKLKYPLSPYLASLKENKEININYILKKLDQIKDHKIICEGAGGVMVPVQRKYFISDLIKDIGFSAVIAARSGLGTINHTLLTIEHLKSKNIDIACIILNGEINEDNEKTIEDISEIPVFSFGYLDFSKKINIFEMFEEKFSFEIR
ncbi:MAG: dethiobiotin synthase [Desulforegulaceae bacterium]|nr:dethiobiotin synthase [Desulforegulaceae bacterium]